MSVGTLEEIIDDNHAIVSTSVGSEHYVSILSFVDKDQLEPGCSVLLNHKVINYASNFNNTFYLKTGKERGNSYQNLRYLRLKGTHKHMEAYLIHFDNHRCLS